jgi:hypothetical protein
VKDKQKKERPMPKLNQMDLLTKFLPLLVSSVAGFFGRFLGTVSNPKMAPLLALGLLLLFLILIYRIRVSRGRGQKSSILFLFLIFMIAGVGAWVRSSFLYWVSAPFFIFFNNSPHHDAGERSLSLPDPSSGSGGSDTFGDSFGIRVLLEDWPTGSTSAERGTPVHQPESGRAPPADQPRGGEAGPSNQPPQGVPYPYHPEEVIGGDSVLSIEGRLLRDQIAPSPIDIYLARVNAEELFEVKVDIIRKMTVLDPTGDWMRRGARALDNRHTSTGESSLERLLSLLDEINRDGVDSSAFRSLTNEMLRRRSDLDEHSAA